MARQARFQLTTTAAALALSAGAWCAAAPTAMAQDGARAGTTTSSEIVVTATRREEGVQRVPVAVTAITSEQIEELAPRTLQDLSGSAPNLFIGMNTAGPGASAIFIRGLGYADIEKTQNPAAGVIIDNVFLGTSTGQLIDTFDLQQIEVTRGPAGIFFGKNTTAGVINVTRSLPTREWGFRGSAGFGDYASQVYRGILNAPLGNAGGIKIGATYRDREGYIDNIFTGQDNGFTEYTGFNAAVDYDLTPWLGVTGIVDIIRQEGGGTPVEYGNVLTANILSGGNPTAVFGPNYNPETGSPIGLGVREVQNNFADADKLDMDIYNLTFNVDTPIGDVVWTTAYIDSFDGVLQDFDGTCSGAPTCPNGGNFLLTSAANPTGTLHTRRDQDYTQLSHEARLSGAAGPVDYLLGYYYFNSELELLQITNSAVFQNATEDTTSNSVFANLDWHVIPSVTLSAGIRWIDEEKEFTKSFTIPAASIVLVAPFGGNDSWTETITRYAAEWQATDTTNFYVTRSEGFRSGGFSIRGTLSEQIEGQQNCVPSDGDAIPNETLCPGNNFIGFDPELVTTWEYGVKNSWLDNRLVVNIAAFSTEVEDFQQSAVVVTPGFGPGTNTYVNNYPEVEIDGYEFEIMMRPTFLWTGFEGLTLSANLGIQDAEVTNGRIDGRRTAASNGQAGAAGSTADFTGQQLLRVPDYNVSYRGSWEFGIGPGTLTLGAGYTYIDDHTLANFGPVGDLEPGYSLIDANIDYEWSRYRIAVTGKNLEDTEYRQHSLPTVFFQGYGAPQTFQVEISAEF
ncbi:MAG: TonB-dependent receptor [Alphaproteobacteria bacterium]|nr:TonB-dependent receptor [Alphaproteobacteria bacterium]